MIKWPVLPPWWSSSDRHWIVICLKSFLRSCTKHQTELVCIFWDLVQFYDHEHFSIHKLKENGWSLLNEGSPIHGPQSIWNKAMEVVGECAHSRICKAPYVWAAGVWLTTHANGAVRMCAHLPLVHNHSLCLPHHHHRQSSKPEDWRLLF